MSEILCGLFSTSFRFSRASNNFRLGPTEIPISVKSPGVSFINASMSTSLLVNLFIYLAPNGEIIDFIKRGILWMLRFRNNGLANWQLSVRTIYLTIIFLINYIKYPTLQIRHDISWESSAGRWISWNIIPYFFWKLEKNVAKCVVCCSRDWCFKG